MKLVVWFLAVAMVGLGMAWQARAQAEKKESGEAESVKHVDAKKAADLLQANKSVVVLDIRTPEEFKGGHLAGAKNLDFRASDFESKLKELDKGTSYLVHCGSGGRSTRSLASFKKLGFKSVYHLDGGIKGWTEAGNPVEK